MDADSVSVATGSDGGAAGSPAKPPSQQMTLLPEDFKPGDNDVICGRGKKCYNHVGNERFRKRVTAMLDEYSRAKSKLDKSGVLATVVDQIRASSPDGGFVKQNEDGRWYEVGDFLAREKTSQAFRDALHERYKSSNVAKKKRRQEEQAKATDKFQRIGVARAHSDTSALEWLALSQDMNGLNMNSARSYDIFQGTNFDVIARMNRLGGVGSDVMAASSSRSIGQRRFLPGRSASTNSTLLSSQPYGNRFQAGAGHGHGPPMMPQRPNSAMGESMHSSGSGGGDPLFGTMPAQSSGLSPPFGPSSGGGGMLNEFGELVGGNAGYHDAGTGGFSLGIASSQLRMPGGGRIRQPQRSDRRRVDREYPAAFRDLMEPSLLGSMHRGTLGDLSEERPEDIMHRSMPNISSSWDASFDFQLASNDVDSNLHHSTPNIHFSEADMREGDEDSFNGDLLEPIPLDEITPRPAAKKSVSEVFKRTLPMTLSPTSPSVEVVSKDLIACLEKLTGSSIKDNNPFEPLPLRPEDDDEIDMVPSNHNLRNLKLPPAEPL